MGRSGPQSYYKLLLACNGPDMRNRVPREGLRSAAYEKELHLLLAKEKPAGYVFGSCLVPDQPDARKSKRDDQLDREVDESRPAAPPPKPAAKRRRKVQVADLPAPEPQPMEPAPVTVTPQPLEPAPDTVTPGDVGDALCEVSEPSLLETWPDTICGCDVTVGRFPATGPL